MLELAPLLGCCKMYCSALRFIFTSLFLLSVDHFCETRSFDRNCWSELCTMQGHQSELCSVQGHQSELCTMQGHQSELCSVRCAARVLQEHTTELSTALDQTNKQRLQLQEAHQTQLVQLFEMRSMQSNSPMRSPTRVQCCHSAATVRCSLVVVRLIMPSRWPKPVCTMANQWLNLINRTP